MAMVTAIPTASPEALSRASSMASEKTIQIIAPAAIPRPTGRSGSNAFTKMNAGTAINGWGRLVKMLHREAFQTGVPRGISTRQMASPSGMFAIAVVMKTPNSAVSAKETPTPMPSANEACEPS